METLMNKKFPSIQGPYLSINDIIADKVAAIIVFMSIQCLYARNYYKRIEVLFSKTKYNSIGFLLVNSNYNTDKGPETLEEIRNYLPAYKVPYIKDSNKELCNYFNALYTPQCFIIDRSFKTIYEGSIDERFLKPSEYKDGIEVGLPWDSQLPDEPDISFIEIFLNAHLANDLPPFNHQPKVGCSIK